MSTERYSNHETAATRLHMRNMQTLAARAAKRAKINTIIHNAIKAALVLAVGAFIACTFI